jgi:hypothetical protein
MSSNTIIDKYFLTLFPEKTYDIDRNFPICEAPPESHAEVQPRKPHIARRGCDLTRYKDPMMWVIISAEWPFLIYTKRYIISVFLNAFKETIQKSATGRSSIAHF